MCSSTRGPAIAPSLVTWPTRNTVISDLFSKSISFSAPGSVSQVRDCAAKLMLFAKRSDITVFLVGHVTKEGAIAGPRVLEHIVDTVLYFEGGKGGPQHRRQGGGAHERARERTTLGVDYNRVILMCAILEKKVGVSLYNQDVFVNVAGGIRVDEPAADLALCCAGAGSFKDRGVPPGAAGVGA